MLYTLHTIATTQSQSLCCRIGSHHKVRSILEHMRRPQTSNIPIPCIAFYLIVQFDVQTYHQVLQFCSVTRILLIKIINNCWRPSLPWCMHTIFIIIILALAKHLCGTIVRGQIKRNRYKFLCEGETANFHPHAVAAPPPPLSSLLHCCCCSIFSKNLL